MSEVRFLPDDKRVAAAAGETLLAASLRSGIPHAHVCGGHAKCSTCRVRVTGGGLEALEPRTEAERDMATRLHFAPEVRLACQARVKDEAAAPVEVARLVLDSEDIELANTASPWCTGGPIGEEKRIAILFSDIRGFTPFAEDLPAYDVIHVLNRHFYLMCAAIERHGGTVDNFLGDGIMALFDREDPREASFRAVAAGLDMLAAMENMRAYVQRVYGRSIDLGVGIHTGLCVVGTIGGTVYRKLTAIGDAVNLASRIESANKAAGTRLLVSSDTYADVRDRVRAGRTVRVPIKGKTGDHALHEVVALADGSAPGAAEVPAAAS